MKKPDFRGKTTVIVCHDAMFGPPHELRDFLLSRRIKTLVFIGHRNRSMEDNSVRSSYREWYESGRMIKKSTAPTTSFLPEAIAYGIDSIVTLYWTLSVPGKIDYYIGLGNLNAFNGLFLRMAGKINQCIYYVIDYIPRRFSHALMNALYHRLDYWCAVFCDATWNYAPQMIVARTSRWKRIFPNQKVTPNGVRVRYDREKPKRLSLNEVMYLGSIVEGQGIQLVIEALQYIIPAVPSVHFSLIGKGPYRKSLEHMIKEKNLEKHVTFIGYIEDPDTTDKRVAKAALGIASYTPTNTVVTHTEPGKIKRYFACGLPVIMTDVGSIAEESFQTGCSLIVPYDKRCLARAVVSLLKNKKKMEIMRKNALAFAKKYRWDHIFTDAFRGLL
ncbi:MAG: hypothetical protein UV63_C0001G0070 [Microgenomates group bacterium GW2011_GWC1_43_11]|uniref:Glycosyl transferase family 1 domain-containing protein n=2 Tax=Candidatus Gottesmaniibacteriota TaxID=1752720 RepID=A0A0G1KZ82_9BACT|nr:MAG: hypothetical protein UV63_C0001G0070 [Microgenomates group bacterium GW2011_GWC1_43_11]KKT39159.1 MAG: hypothetical protein UW22_C0001G0070 [Candidatus Gottesmanbacteria bacterium GW2011_GWB1_44_11c]KKT61632.1 MAG: hypothetical protein UW52_C0001G0070 [Candidatus Gottesmanbacteria bacterium GW2011_GWA1_44_24b]HCM82171.1 hypothetical protein [Patescibacteria group bacterium]